MKISELLGKGLLAKSASNKEEVQGSLAIAERFVERAEGNKKIEYYDISLSLAYQSMFHAARALLFKSGYKERSHTALIGALKEIYADNAELQELLEVFDSYRKTRHAVQYSGAGCSEGDATEAIGDAEKFLDLADTLLAKAEKNGCSEKTGNAPQNRTRNK
ncbi:MAG: HEPN domain-containing protein [Candidatus Diapherotrites archaeon]|nr:HEPN domain-containing protein [Candidatus Micrarchaeota archaeon]MBU1939986.1 HEPN domain-containing protein [Candidatus Micrarchaeota archaeon]